MMMSPESFIEQHSNDSYEELIAIRDGLMDGLKQFEAEGIPEDEMIICPGPDVVYQMSLQYLSVLCKKIAEVYNRDVVWGDVEDDLNEGTEEPDNDASTHEVFSEKEKLEVAESPDMIAIGVVDAWGIGDSVCIRFYGSGRMGISWDQLSYGSHNSGDGFFDSSSLLEDLKRLDIGHWDPDYQPDCAILDGMGWSVEVLSGERSFVTVGSNAWPEELEALIGALRPYIPASLQESIRKRLE